MHWTVGHSKTAAAGLVSLAATALLFRPPSFAAGVLMVSLVLLAVAITGRMRTETGRTHH